MVVYIVKIQGSWGPKGLLCGIRTRKWKPAEAKTSVLSLSLSAHGLSVSAFHYTSVSLFSLHILSLSSHPMALCPFVLVTGWDRWSLSPNSEVPGIGFHLDETSTLGPIQWGLGGGAKEQEAGLRSRTAGKGGKEGHSWPKGALWAARHHRKCLLVSGYPVISP